MFTINHKMSENMNLDTTNFQIFKIWTPPMQEPSPATGTGSEIPGQKWTAAHQRWCHLSGISDTER